MLKTHCIICGHETPLEKACRITLTFGAYTPGKEGKKVENNDVCEDCAHHFRNIMTCPPMEEEKTEEPKPKKTKKPKKYGKEGRCITVARTRAGMSQKDLAQKIFYDKSSLATWEQGRGKPDWNALEKELPELPEIREKGCAAYCENPAYCQEGDGSCYHSIGCFAKAKKQKEPNAD